MDIDKTVAQALILIETINKDYELCQEDNCDDCLLRARIIHTLIDLLDHLGYTVEEL